MAPLSDFSDSQERMTWTSRSAVSVRYHSGQTLFTVFACSHPHSQFHFLSCQLVWQGAMFGNQMMSTTEMRPTRIASSGSQTLSPARQARGSRKTNVSWLSHSVGTEAGNEHTRIHRINATGDGRVHVREADGGVAVHGID